MKKCNKCGVEKPNTSEFFAKNKTCVGGLTSTCKKCINYRTSQWKKENKIKITDSEDYHKKARERTQRRTKWLAENEPIVYQAKALLTSLGDRCNKNNLFRDDVFKTRKYIAEWLERQPNCECCNVKFSIGKKDKGRALDSSPSLDRFNLKIGYTKENTKLICWRCNNIKRNYTQHDLKLVAEWMDKVEIIDEK